MAGAQHLLRKAAIEKMSSPEQLDMAMRVTSPLSWIALLTLGALIVTAVVASIIGRMSVKVDATGLLLRGETLQTIQSTGNGVVAAMEVQEGDTVEEGQLVARLDLPELDSEIRATEDRIADLAAQTSSRQAQLASLRSTYLQQLGDLQQRRRSIQILVDKQLKTRNDLAAIDAQISQLRTQMVQSDMGETERENQLQEQRRKLAQLLEKKAASTEVRSPYRGRVAAVLKPRGQLVKQGERLINLEDPDAPFHVLLFVAFAEGKKIAPGMSVRIAPSTVKPEEYGFILGKVLDISSQAVTPEEVRNTLNNDQLANKFAQDTPFRVRAVPELDSRSASGFKWTSAGGPPFNIAANTPVTGQIITEKRRPISYVIPTVKKTLGI